MDKILAEVDFSKMPNNLIPVITQDYWSKEILMCAFANRKALENTLKTRQATYYSRSKKSLWIKGEISGETQLVKEIKIDCDGDSVIYLVEIKNVSCHLGYKSCFYRDYKLNTQKDNGWVENQPVIVSPDELYKNG